MSKKASGANLSKREQLRAERRRRSLVWNVILLGGGGLALLAVIAYLVATARPGALTDEKLILDEGKAHVNSSVGVKPQYSHYPPSSGTHYGDQVAPWGVYAEPIEEGVFVHNLEHGGVVFLYYCDEPCPDLERQFDDLYKKAPPARPFTTVKILVTPYDKAKMPKPIVALAWDHELDMDKFDEATMLQWYKRFVNLGPEGSQLP